MWLSVQTRWLVSFLCLHISWHGGSPYILTSLRGIVFLLSIFLRSSIVWMFNCVCWLNDWWMDWMYKWGSGECKRKVRRQMDGEAETILWLPESDVGSWGEGENRWTSEKPGKGTQLGLRHDWREKSRMFLWIFHLRDGDDESPPDILCV